MPFWRAHSIMIRLTWTADNKAGELSRNWRIACMKDKTKSKRWVTNFSVPHTFAFGGPERYKRERYTWGKTEERGLRLVNAGYWTVCLTRSECCEARGKRGTRNLESRRRGRCTRRMRARDEVTMEYGDWERMIGSSWRFLDTGGSLQKHLLPNPNRKTHLCRKLEGAVPEKAQSELLAAAQEGEEPDFCIAVVHTLHESEITLHGVELHALRSLAALQLLERLSLLSEV